VLESGLSCIGVTGFVFVSADCALAMEPLSAAARVIANKLRAIFITGLSLGNGNGMDMRLVAAGACLGGFLGGFRAEGRRSLRRPEGVKPGPVGIPRRELSQAQSSIAAACSV